MLAPGSGQWDLCARGVARNDRGDIVGGTLVSLEPVDEVDATAAWKAWFEERASELNGVEDVDGELGRGGQS